jgi:hypothetical protein
MVNSPLKAFPVVFTGFALSFLRKKATLNGSLQLQTAIESD